MAQDAEKLDAQARRLSELKKYARVTNRAISDAVGVTERQVQRWLAGESDIDPQNLKKVATFFGSTPDYIEYGTSSGRKAGDTPDILASGSVYDELRRLNERVDQIHAMITQLLATEIVADLQASSPEAETDATERDRRAA